jgi:hypothetical protein
MSKFTKSAIFTAAFLSFQAATQDVQKLDGSQITAQQDSDVRVVLTNTTPQSCDAQTHNMQIAASKGAGDGMDRQALLKCEFENGKRDTEISAQNDGSITKSTQILVRSIG